MMMHQPAPPTPPPLRRSSHSSPSTSRTPTPSYSNPNSQAAGINSAYTAALPSTYRRSSFPVSPAIHLNSSSQQIPAGLSLEMRGCRDDDDYERVTGSKAPFYSISSAASSTRSHSAEGGSSTRNSSRTNSIGSDSGGSDSTRGWLANSGRSWSVNSGIEKKKREAIKGWEDPALAAARKALWDDVAVSTEGETGKDEVSKKQKSGGTEDEEAVEFDDNEDENEDEDGADEEEKEEWGFSSPRPPCHSTLSPGPSCLRTTATPSPRFASLSLNDSSTSSSSPSTSPHDRDNERGVSPSPSSTSSQTSLTTPSIRFSPDPPKTAATYSKMDYERKGDLPVEKLSIREWIELQGVREAVGVWSGKIAKWEEGAEESQPTSAGMGTGSSNGGSGIREGRSTGEKSLYPLAALTGVVTVSKSTPNSPTSSPRTGSLPFSN